MGRYSKLLNSGDDDVIRLKKDIAQLQSEWQSRFRKLENELVSCRSELHQHRRRTNTALKHSYNFVRRQVCGDKDIYEASDGSSEFTEPLGQPYLQSLNISFNSATADNQAGEKAEIQKDQMMEVETIVIED